ncbi:MAG: methionyl aminopeptidase [Archaeoglobi archaeon]|nr:type II methionyl aminopeptidase [Candidatus Mnemosynella bozhongmuii]MDK2781152.1 methionyl aminopeptidase [Archaeoglobi archaeon]
MEEYFISGSIASEVRNFAVRIAEKDRSLIEIAEKVEEKILSLGGEIAFPCNLCLNSVAAHYTPNRGEERRLKNGDLLSIDIGVHVDGYIADTATTVRVGSGDDEMRKIAEEAIERAAEIVRSGVRTSEIGERIEKFISSTGYRVVRGLNGHSIDRFRLHAGITIPNERCSEAVRLKKGDVITIEPFITKGSREVMRVRGRIYRIMRNDPGRLRSEEAKRLLQNLSERFGSLPFSMRWVEDGGGLEELIKKMCIHEYPVVLSADNSEVAQVEHTLIVGENSCEVITL